MLPALSTRISPRLLFANCSVAPPGAGVAVSAGVVSAGVVSAGVVSAAALSGVVDP